MKIVAKPKTEAKVLKTVKNEATAEEIRKHIVSQAQCCVVHLCGCNCKC
jgi:hypothetical protein